MEFIADLKSQFLAYYESIIIAIPKMLIGLVIIISFLLIASFIRKKLISLLYNKAEDKLLINFLDGAFRILNLTIASLLFLYIVGLADIAGSILGAATLSSFIIGFAFKDIAENFLAGVIMAFNRPFRIGDTVKTADIEGKIVEMNLRDTHLKTFDGKDVYIPNGQIIKNPLFNYTIDGFLRKSYVIGLDYDSDIDLARKIMVETILKVKGIVLESRPPSTFIKSLTSSTINVELHYWINTFDNKESPSEMHTQAIKNTLLNLSSAGVKMPGDIVEVKNYNETVFQTN